MAGRRSKLDPFVALVCGNILLRVTGKICDPIFARIVYEPKRKMPDPRGVSSFVHIGVEGFKDVGFTTANGRLDPNESKKKAIFSRKPNALTPQTRPQTGLVQRLDQSNTTENRPSPTPRPVKHDRKPF